MPPTPIVRLLVLCAALLAPVGVAGAQAADAPVDDIDDRVAAALYERGVFLLGTGDAENARKMFIESLERSPDGSVAEDALNMLRQTNERLGLPPESGRPEPGGVLDPYAEDSGDDVLDPYGSASASDTGGVLDPYGDASGVSPSVPGQDEGGGDVGARRGLTFWGGLYGTTLGLALGGPLDEDGDLRGGAVVAGVALGAGAAVGTYYLTGKRPLTEGQSAAVASAGTWGAVNFGLLGDVLSGRDTETNTGYKFVAAGGAVGTGLGYWYATTADPSVGDVSLTNSLSIYGTLGGLLLGFAIDPPRDEAYSLNASIGSTAGIIAGLYLAERVEVTRRRMFLVDAGALAGAAAPYLLIMPLTDNDQAVAFLSTLSMLGGAGLAWYFTDDDDEDELGPNETLDPGVARAALLRRERSGRWSLGAPLPRPLIDQASGPGAVGLGLGIDLAAGSF